LLDAARVELRRDRAVEAERFVGDGRFVSDYFRAELLHRLPPLEAGSLDYTSVPERMCDGLCDSDTTRHEFKRGRPHLRCAGRVVLEVTALTSRDPVVSSGFVEPVGLSAGRSLSPQCVDADGGDATGDGLPGLQENLQHQDCSADDEPEGDRERQLPATQARPVSGEPNPEPQRPRAQPDDDADRVAQRYANRTQNQKQRSRRDSEP
jgi:hypothetical protein